LPSRRRYIPKADGKQRPLGIAALEDKIVQAAVVAILTPIYEAEFLGFSYGFRPGRGPQRKRLKAKLREIKETLRRHRHTPIDEQGRWLGAMMKGHFAYFAVAAGAVKAGKIVRVLEPFAPMAPGVFLYYPSRHQMMPKLRAFIDHVKSRSDARQQNPNSR